MKTLSDATLREVWSQSTLFGNVYLSEYTLSKYVLQLQYARSTIHCKHVSIVCSNMPYTDELLSLNVSKRSFWYVRPTRTQISLCTRTVVPHEDLHPRLTMMRPGEESDQPMRMRIQIWIFAGRTCPWVRFLMLQLNPVSILQKPVAGRYWPVRVADGPITACYRFIKNAMLAGIFTCIYLQWKEHWLMSHHSVYLREIELYHFSRKLLKMVLWILEKLRPAGSSTQGFCNLSLH